MIRTGKALGWALLFMLIPFMVYGQRIRFYNSEQGLPNSLIHKVSQDDKGFIWLATESGASYFDGMRFTTFHHDPNRHGSLTSDLVKTIYTDSRGVTWIGTSDGLQIYDPENNTFHDFPLQYPDFSGTPYISSITESKEHEKLLVSVAGLGIMVYDLKTHLIDTATTRKLSGVYETNYLGILVLDHKGCLWSYAEQGYFFRMNLSRMEIDTLKWSPVLQEESKKLVVSALTEDPVTRNVLIGTYNNGIYIYDRSLDYIRRPQGASSSKYRIRALFAETRKGQEDELNIWVGSEDSGLKKFDREKEEIIEPDFQYAPIDLENCKVHSIMQDAQGNIWAGIFQKGLLIIPRSVNNFEYIKLSSAQGSMSVNIACATSMIRDVTGALWVGTDGGGLFRILNDGTKIRYTAENTPLPNNAILDMAADRRGILWISTYMGGITTYSPQNGFQAFSNDPELQKVNCFLYDRENDKLYLGTLGHGLKVLSFADNRISSLSESGDLVWISSFCLDNSGNLWVGHTEGISCFSTKSGEMVYKDVRDYMQGITVNSSYNDRNGSMWFGSPEGVFHFDKTTRTIVRYTQEDGLASNLVCSIEQDPWGILWVSTSNGLSRFDPRTGTFTNFYVYDGLQDNEFRNKASYVDSDGRIYFGGINGITAFYPERVRTEEKLASGIYFSELKVLNRNVSYNKTLGKKNVLDRHISQARQITLKKNQNMFSLEFAVLEYANPEKVVYSYILEGFDNDWRYTDSKNRLATYTNIPEGSYTFRVKAFFEGSPEARNAVYNSINIRILPPWYKTFWAYLVYAGIFILLVWWFINFLIRRKKHRQEKLELEKKEMKLRMFTDLTHEIRTPFTLVMTPLKTMQETETDGRRKEMFNFMYRNILRILRLLNQLMDIRKIDNQQFNMHFRRTDLVFFIQDIIKSFDQLAIIRNIDFRLLSSFESLEAWIDLENFDKVLFNILSNAFKFTPDHGNILISLDTISNISGEGLPNHVSEFIQIRIENSGSRLDENEKERIFDRFYQGNDNAMASGSGVGLHLAKMIVQLHYGKIKAKNTDHGVAFVIYIPLSNKHLSPEEIAGGITNTEIRTKIREADDLHPEKDFIELPPEEHELQAKPSKSKRTLVFVDDDAELGKYLWMELSDKYNINFCTNANDAWKSISTTLPDAVLVDLLMPEENGISLCKKIRKNPETNHLPIIILTSEADEESERHCIENGADHFLSKPINLELLKSTIAQVIQMRDTIRNKYQSMAKPDFDRIKVSSPDSRLIAKVVETIRQNIENSEFSVDDLSREVGLSRVHLNRKLKQNVNISPNSLIKSIRLKQAAYLLINNKVNISDVAYKVGFSSHSYFSNNFKEYFGMAPTEFVVKYTQLEDKESLNKLFEN